MTNNSEHSLRPLVMSAAESHHRSWVTYTDDGVAVVRHERILGGSIHVPPERQYPTILSTFTALDKALTAQSNSPPLKSGKTLREAFDQEFKHYLDQVAALSASKAWEPDYGSYVYDGFEQKLYLIAPEFWHRLALVTSTAKLITDPAGELTSHEIRKKLENLVVGFIGASVGSNLVEGAARELRFRQAKIADPDHLEMTNLNRIERGSLRYLVQSRASRKDLRNTYDMKHVNKAVLTAYEQQLVDPYADWFVYSDGLHAQNMDQFLGGGDNEPAVDIIVEEVDDFSLKVEIRKEARRRGIPVLMLSDFGHRAQAQFQDYQRHPDMSLGYNVSDRVLLERLEQLMSSGNREHLMSFARGLAGDDFAQDEFLKWVEQEGEQPTNSLPQSGATAMISGGWGGKLVALYALGHSLPQRMVFDARHATLSVHR